jgi:hypothetical protein
MNRYDVTVFVNTDNENFFGWKASHPMAEVATFHIDAASAQAAADRMFDIGNKLPATEMFTADDEYVPITDDEGVAYPVDVRSVSTGDLMIVRDAEGHSVILVVASFGWEQLPEPVNPIVELVDAGSRVTSRV